MKYVIYIFHISFYFIFYMIYTKRNPKLDFLKQKKTAKKPSSTSHPSLKQTNPRTTKKRPRHLDRSLDIEVARSAYFSSM